MASLIHPLKYFLERIMARVLQGHGGKVRIDGRTITHLRFVDDSGVLAEGQELEALVKVLKGPN